MRGRTHVFVGCSRRVRRGSRPLVNLVAYVPAASSAFRVNLTELKSVIEALSPDELTDLAAFIRDRDNAAWDEQIDADFAEGGRLRAVLAEVRADIKARRLNALP